MNLRILEIAANTENNKILDKHTHKSKNKNPMCGDVMEITLLVKNNKVIDMAKKIRPSKRGELEIIDILKIYLNQNSLSVYLLERGSAWLDTGNVDSFHEASSYIRTLEHRQGLKIGCPEEVAWRNGWINNKQLLKLSKPLKKSGYGEYLIQLTK